MALVFGRKYSEAPPATGGSGRWIKSLKEGETRIRFLQEIKDWHVYYEHYNPAGTAFPCTGDRDTCPGCTSSNERMKQAGRKNAVNALVNGYVDVYKLPVKLTNRLVIRSERAGGTITDRDYLITRVGKDKDTEYDLEALPERMVDISQYQQADIEQMLADQFMENFPDFSPDTTGETKSQEQPKYDVPGLRGSSEDPPFEEPSTTQDAGEVEVTEAELRAMGLWELIGLVEREQIKLPEEVKASADPDQIIDYLLENA